MTNKRYLLHIGALVLFFAITAFFFYPLVFGGKKIRQGDIEHHKGMSKEIVDYRNQKGEEPLWTNSMFGGMPAYQISTLYPANGYNYVQKAFMKILPYPAVMILICMIGFYFLLTTLKVDPWLAVAGAIGYGLSSYFILIIPAGHNSKITAIAYMAPVLMGVLMSFRGRMYLGAALTALSLGLEITANHLQITYYLLFIVVLVGLGEFIRMAMKKQLAEFGKAAALLVVALIIAILPNISSLYLTDEYGKYSTRGPSELTIGPDGKTKTSDEALPFSYATQWCYGVGESFSLIIPDYSGGASAALNTYAPNALDGVQGNEKIKDIVAQYGSAYFGDQPFTSGPVYVGAIFCFLFILGLFIVKDSIKWWLLAATVLSITLAWGYHAETWVKLFFDHVPGFNKFRALSMMLVIAELTIPLLGILAVQEIFRDKEAFKKHIRSFYIAFALTGGFCLLVWLTPTSFVDTMSDSQREEQMQRVTQGGLDKASATEFVDILADARENMVSSDAGRSFLFILAAGLLLFGFSRFSIPPMAVSGILALLILVDMWGVASRYLNDDDKQSDYVKVGRKGDLPPPAMTPADEQILQDKDPNYRVLNASVDVWNDVTTSYYHKSIGGYHGAKLKRIQEVYDFYLGQSINKVRSLGPMVQSDSLTQAMLAQQNALNMLNARYIIVPVQTQDGAQQIVVRNRSALGNAWFVNSIKQVANADDEIKTIGTINPRTTVALDKRYEAEVSGFTPKYDSTARIKLTAYEPNDLKYESNAASEQLAVFSEIYYDKGWNVYVDKQPAKYFRADYLLRAMRIPAGKHEIEFKFEPVMYAKGEKIAGIGSVLLLLLVAGGIFMDWKEQKKQNAKQAA